MVRHTLSRLIKKEYLKSILFPLLMIEMMLLGVYFWSNAYVNEATIKALIEETQIQIKEISSRSASIINHEFETISNMTRLFQKEHENFFEHYTPKNVLQNDASYAVLSDGVITNHAKKEDACTLFYSSVHKNEPFRLEKAIATEQLDYFYNALLKTNANIAQVYFNSYDSMNRLCPFMKDALSQYPHDIDIPSYNFYYLADAKHNPKRDVVWTSAYLDPAGLGWMISAIAPVYKNDFLEGVVGVDVTLDQIIQSILSIKLPYTSMALLIDQEGHILGMSKALEPLLGIQLPTQYDYQAPISSTITQPQNYNIFENKENHLAQHLSQMLRSKKSLDHFSDVVDDFIVTQNAIAETGWQFILLLDKDSLLAKTDALKTKTNNVGYLALALMALFYMIFIFIILKRANAFSTQILDPLYDVIKATRQLKDKLTTMPFKHSEIIEMDMLLNHFTSMANELQSLYDSMDKKIKEGVLENMETQKMMIYQSRLAQMGEMISMIAHQWRQPLGAISTVTASIKLKQQLKKFDLFTAEGQSAQEQFLNDSITKIEHYIQFLTTTIDDFRNFFKPDQHTEKTSLQTLIDKSLKIIGKSLDVHQISLHVKNVASRDFLTYEAQVTQVLINILKNAQDVILEKKIENGTIWLNAYEEDDAFVITIEDNAGGIPESIISKIFDPYFSTKMEKNGTGLGLYMAKTIIEEHCHGSLSVQNTTQGALFTIKICGESCASQPK